MGLPGITASHNIISFMMSPMTAVNRKTSACFQRGMFSRTWNTNRIDSRKLNMSDMMNDMKPAGTDGM